MKKILNRFLEDSQEEKRELIELFRHNKVDLRYGQTLLHLCAKIGYVDLLKDVFVAFGDEIKVDEIQTIGNHSATPLLLALKTLHDIESIPFIGLVEDSEDSEESSIEFDSYGVLCRNLAQKQRNVIDMLIKKGANIETTRALCSPKLATLLDNIIASSSSSSQESEEPTSFSSSHSQGDSSESSG